VASAAWSDLTRVNGLAVAIITALGSDVWPLWLFIFEQAER
jgi:hypothetical protein